MNRKQRTLSSLLEPGFADGYDQFKELIEFTGKLDTLAVTERAFGRLFELALVAIVEGLNRVEEELEIEPTEALVLAWRAFGCAIASANGQAFTIEGKQQVRREMLIQFKEGYDKTLKALIYGIPEDTQ